MTSSISSYLKDQLVTIIYFVLTSIMKLPFTLSTHAAEKHLDVYNLSASVFFNERVLYRGIQQCLNNPNTENRNGKRFEMTKTFCYDIRVLGFTNEPNNKIKVIFTRTKNLIFVITAYPVA